MAIDDLKYAQGPAKIATAEDLAKDQAGITYPNLHRRIDDEIGSNSQIFIGDGHTKSFQIIYVRTLDEIISVTVNDTSVSNYTLDEDIITFTTAPKANATIVVTFTFTQEENECASYSLTMGGTHSYRTVGYKYHDEESTTSEIP